MTFSSYPSAEHIEAELKSNSMWPTDPDKQTLARYVAGIVAEAGAAEWERLVGWNPFLAGWSENGLDASPTTRQFSLVETGGWLDFGGAAQSVALVQRGTEAPLIWGQGYWLDLLSPASGAIRGLQLASGYPLAPSGAATIAVTGVWGRVASVPGDVFLTLMKREMATMMDLIENEQSVASIEQDGFSKDYDIVGVRTQKDIAESGDRDFQNIAARWKRVIC